jgi:hypothetical protein
VLLEIFPEKVFAHAGNGYVTIVLVPLKVTERGTQQPDGSLSGEYCSVNQRLLCDTNSGGHGDWNVTRMKADAIDVGAKLGKLVELRLL